MVSKTDKRGRKKGDPKIGGRKKGTPNKTPSEKRALTDQLMEWGLARVFKQKEQLDLRETLGLVYKVMPYYQGKMPVPKDAGDGDGDDILTIAPNV